MKKKKTTSWCYKGFKSYQPLNTWWIEKVRLRSDTAGYQHDLLRYCEKETNKRFGRIEFAIEKEIKIMKTITILKRNKLLKNIVFFITVYVLFTATFQLDVWAQEVQRVYYEDCEDTTFTEHFLERHYGTGYQPYWEEFISEVSRSDESPHSGQYCMTYDPWTTGNPHAVVGYAGANYGNTSHFDLSLYNQRNWYFRWYQRWETGIDWSGSAQNKLLYINYSHSGDFVFTIQRNGSSNFHITIRDHDTYSIVVTQVRQI